MSRWLAAHLSWLVCALLALWAPPLLFTMGVDLGLITEAARADFRRSPTSR